VVRDRAIGQIAAGAAVMRRDVEVDARDRQAPAVRDGIVERDEHGAWATKVSCAVPRAPTGQPYEAQTRQ